ncbi:hypothetical protein BJX96DRAFT_184480 [Aspergillus floccosus]
MIRRRAFYTETTKNGINSDSTSPIETKWYPTGSPWSPTAPSRLPIAQLAIELPSREDPTEPTLHAYDTWIQSWQALGSTQATRDGRSSSDTGIKAEESAVVQRAKEAEWRAKHAYTDVSGIAQSKSYESICSRVLRVEIPTREHLTHRDIYDYIIAIARRGDICGEADAHTLWPDGTSCDYGTATPTLRRWTPRRRDIWGDTVRGNTATIHDAVDNLYYSCADARTNVSDYECLADCLMAVFVRDYSADDASGVYVQGTSLLRKGSETVLDTRRVERAMSEICSYTYYESLVRGATEILGLDQHGAACAAADIIASGHSSSYLIVRNLSSGTEQTLGFMEGLAQLCGRESVPFAYGSLVAYVNDMTDLATDVETVDMNSAVEAAARLHTTARAAYNSMRTLCMSRDDYGIVCCCASIYHVITTRSCNAWVDRPSELKEDSSIKQAHDHADGRRMAEWLVSAQEDGGRSISGIDKMIDWVISIVAEDPSEQNRSCCDRRLELERAMCDWYHALIQCYCSVVSGLSAREHGAAVVEFKKAELHVRELISERDDRELLLYALRWVGANDGEAARGWAWWCEPQVVTASSISNYLRRPSILNIGPD